MKTSYWLSGSLALFLTVIAMAWAQEDRVGFPKDYQNSFKLYHVFNHDERVSLRELWINPAGAKVEDGKPFPYGTVIVMLGYRPQSTDGKPVKDEKGLYVKGELTRVDVMRKEKDFGEIYGESRSGEWEFNAYRPNGEVMPGDNSRCAKCHLKASVTDFVFSASQLSKK